MSKGEILKRISSFLKVCAYLCGFFLLICICRTEDADYGSMTPWVITCLVLLIAGAMVCEEVAILHGQKRHSEVSPRDMGSTGEWDDEWDYQRPLFSCSFIVLILGVFSAWIVLPQLLPEFRFVWAGFIAAWILVVGAFLGIVWILGRFNVKLQLELTDSLKTRIWAAIRVVFGWTAGMSAVAGLTWVISCGALTSPYATVAFTVFGLALVGVIIASLFVK